MEKISITGEYIHLNQLLKLAGLVENGGEANSVIEEGLVKVNNKQELRKRNKLYKGMKVKFEGKEVEVI